MMELEFLKDKASDPVRNIPYRIRGRVMMDSSMATTMLHVDENRWIHVGLDACSCTSSVAALAHWLCPAAEQPRTLHELKHEFHAVPLDQCTVILDPEPKLLVISTAPHKCAILCMGSNFVLLQSNQDDTRGGQRFTLHDCLCRGGTRFTLDQVNELIRQLAAAAARGAVDHEHVFERYFGSRFKRGDPGEYWAVTLPVTCDDLWTSSNGLERFDSPLYAFKLL